MGTIRQVSQEDESCLKIRVLDLFSGLGGWSEAFKERGHEVVTVDREAKFSPTILSDVNNLEASELGKFDIVLASPPCECFSVMTVSRYWNHQGDPGSQAKDAIQTVKNTIKLIHEIDPRFWVLENPRALLRKVIGKPAYTVTYCQYGATYMKPTDLWGKIPDNFHPRRCSRYAKCHVPTPRGSHNNPGSNGLGKNTELMAKIPYGLSLAMCISAEVPVSTEQPEGNK